jgi:hypothetical protein
MTTSDPLWPTSPVPHFWLDDRLKGPVLGDRRWEGHRREFISVSPIKHYLLPQFWLLVLLTTNSIATATSDDLKHVWSTNSFTLLWQAFYNHSYDFNFNAFVHYLVSPLVYVLNTRDPQSASSTQTHLLQSQLQFRCSDELFSTSTHGSHLNLLVLV